MRLTVFLVHDISSHSLINTGGALEACLDDSDANTNNPVVRYKSVLGTTLNSVYHIQLSPHKDTQAGGPELQ